MIRPIAMCAGVLAVSMSLLACDKPGATEQQKESNAVDKVAQAQNQADQKVQNANANAERDIATAQANFEKTREDYRHEKRKDLVDFNKQLADLDAKAKTATGKSKTDLTNTVTTARAKEEAFERDLQSLDTATGTTWDAAKTNLDREWDALKASLNNTSGSPSLDLTH